MCAYSLHAIVLMLGALHLRACRWASHSKTGCASSATPTTALATSSGFRTGPAAREILLRGKYVNGKSMLAFLVICG
jgi:hypothetical protein